MITLLSKNLFFIKEHTGIFKASNNYDIIDPETQKIIFECREPKLGIFTKILRFTDYKKYTPFEVYINTTEQQPVLKLKRGVSFFISNVYVYSGNDILVGIFKQKFWSIGGKYEVCDKDGRPICILKGNWIGWDFSFERNGVQLAQVTKKWAGIGKELFTTADNYMLSIDASVNESDTIREMILASVICIDMVQKEK